MQNILIQEKTWQKPQTGLYNLNIDACFFDDGVGAVAAILRNCRGEAIAGASETFDHAYNAQAAETLALRRGLQMISDLGCSKVEVESDCLELMDACNGKMDIRGPNSAFLADCFHLAHGITSISFNHCPREANGLPHFLARNCFESKTSCVCLDVTPNFLLSLVLHDVTLPRYK